MTQDRHYNLIRKLRPRKIILPVLIGLGLVAWFIFREIDAEVLSYLDFTFRAAVWLFIAWLCMAFRDIGYIIRIRILSDRELSWKQAFNVIMLWEFTSAITPSTVGGTAVAVVFLHKEGMTVGKSTSVVLATSFLDEFYFVIMLPLIILITGTQPLFLTTDLSQYSFLNNLLILTVAGYLVILAWVVLVGYGLFFNPHAISSLIIKIFSLPVLRRWKQSAVNAGNDIIRSSVELKMKRASFWVKAGAATFLSWTARYWIVNAILTAFFVVGDHFLIFARQLVTWVLMILSPSPGGSGFAELILGRFISDQIPAGQAVAGSIALAVAIIWRIISYYPYLVIGALILPGWIQRKFVTPFLHKK